MGNGISRSRIVTGIAMVLLPLIALFLFLLSLSARRGKIAVRLLVAPSNASILLDETVTKAGKKYLVAGEHSLKVSKDGFTSYSGNFVVTKEEDNTVVVSLSPVTAAAQSEYLADPAFAEIEGITGERSRQEGEELYSNNPILNHLPYKSPSFNIDYGVSANKVVTVVISYDSNFSKKYALSLIKSWGVAVETLKIKYQKY